jgi:septal ring factor EnvC (AmiA/AmiB activator)
MNTEEPVQAQLYSPMLTQPTSISFQDQLNEITSGQRAAERMTPYNPEAAAFIASQAYNAKNKVLGEQFRMNQAEKQRVNEQNINMLNEAQQKNLAILDQQYARKSQAKSNTKTQAIEIAKAIANKYAQNKAENRKAKVMENMYPAFSFTQEGTAYKNPMYMAGFGPGMGREKTKGALASGYGYTYDEEGDIIGTRKLKSDEVKNGGIVKAFKNF